jgi:hypothetical protein
MEVIKECRVVKTLGINRKISCDHSRMDHDLAVSYLGGILGRIWPATRAGCESDGFACGWWKQTGQSA